MLLSNLFKIPTVVVAPVIPVAPVASPLTEQQLEESGIATLVKASLMELKVVSELLNQGLNVQEDLAEMRADIEEDEPETEEGLETED
jgi:hypothetical protein